MDVGYLANAVVPMFEPNAIALGFFFVGNGIKFSATDSYELHCPLTEQATDRSAAARSVDY